jgi:hypothetical protein
MPKSNGTVKADVQIGGADVAAGNPLFVDIVDATGVTVDVNLDKDNDSVTCWQPTHDDLNLNANLQVGDSDVGAANRVPVEHGPAKVASASLSAAIALNNTTSTVIQASNTSRCYFTVYNDGNQPAWIKLQTAATDNDAKGILLDPGGTWEMPQNCIYTGEISAISVTGTPSVYTVEY